jgi:hypothetical protein
MEELMEQNKCHEAMNPESARNDRIEEPCEEA